MSHEGEFLLSSYRNLSFILINSDCDLIHKTVHGGLCRPYLQVQGKIKGHGSHIV